MITIYKRNNVNEFEAYLAVDHEAGEMWGYDPMWTNSPEFLQMDPEDLKSRFEGSFNWAVAETDEDPFDGLPMNAEVLRNYPPGTEEVPEVELEPEESEQTAKNAARGALNALEDAGGDSPGNLKLAAEDGLSGYEECDDVLREMHKNLAEWDGEDLSKSPPAWTGDEDIPEFVYDVIKRVIAGDVVWDKFEGYSKQTAQAVRNSLEDNLTQPQGWSLSSLVDDLQDMYSGMDDEQAMNIVRTETSAILNSAREEAYKERADSESYSYKWQGPTDGRTTDVCREVKKEVDARGGSVPLEDLKQILQSKAEKYEDTREGGTPERVDEWTPHYQCRHTFIRDVKADL